MKKLNLILLAICSAFMGHAQQPIFSNVYLANTTDRNIINFSIPREANVRHYRIEASNDSITFEVIATVPSKGNSELTKNYNYDLSGYSFKYYRIGMVNMNATIPYSQVVGAREDIPVRRLKIKTKSMFTSPDALARK